MGLREGNHGKVWRRWAVDLQDHGSWSGILACSNHCRPSASVCWRELHGAIDNGCLECNSEQLSFCSNNNIREWAMEFQHLSPMFNAGLSGSWLSSRLRKCVGGRIALVSIEKLGHSSNWRAWMPYSYGSSFPLSNEVVLL